MGLSGVCPNLLKYMSLSYMQISYTYITTNIEYVKMKRGHFTFMHVVSRPKREKDGTVVHASHRDRRSKLKSLELGTLYTNK